MQTHFSRPCSTHRYAYISVWSYICISIYRYVYIWCKGQHTPLQIKEIWISVSYVNMKSANGGAQIKPEPQVASVYLGRYLATESCTCYNNPKANSKQFTSLAIREKQTLKHLISTMSTSLRQCAQPHKSIALRCRTVVQETSRSFTYTAENTVARKGNTSWQPQKRPNQEETAR